MSLTPAATTVDASAAASRSATTSDDEGIAYNFSTSLIVRTAVAAGIIVLVLSALVLFFNLSQWLRNARRTKRRRSKHKRRVNEAQASLFEMAAWSDRPGQMQIPIDMGVSTLPAPLWKKILSMGMYSRQHIGRDLGGGLSTKGRTGPRGRKAMREKKKMEKDERVLRRGGMNAWNVHEWEGEAQ